MKIFVAVVGFLTLWPALLNSGTTSQIWIAAISDTQKPVLNSVNSAELECMSKNIYFEAALESTAGKLAVAQVTMNRVSSKQFPNTVCKVVYQGGHYTTGVPIKHRCQFSWYCDGKPDEPYLGAMWRESSEIAAYVLATPDLRDITDGATHYHANYISSPTWADTRSKTAAIDTHIFFNKTIKSVKKN